MVDFSLYTSGLLCHEIVIQSLCGWSYLKARKKYPPGTKQGKYLNDSCWINAARHKWIQNHLKVLAGVKPGHRRLSIPYPLLSQGNVKCMKNSSKSCLVVFLELSTAIFVSSPREVLCSASAILAFKGLQWCHWQGLTPIGSHPAAGHH